MALNAERARAEREDLVEARAVSDAKSLGERMDEAIAWACISASEIARVARDDRHLACRLEGDFPTGLRERWERRLELVGGLAVGALYIRSKIPRSRTSVPKDACGSLGV